MRATLLLADAAQVDPTGKVHLLGGGWSMTSSPLGSFCLVVLIAVDWSETDLEHVAMVRLEDADGRVVAVGPPDRAKPLVKEHRFVAARPQGLPPGSDADVHVVWTFGAGLNLPPGRYLWRLEIDGATSEPWSLPFVVRRPGGNR